LRISTDELATAQPLPSRRPAPAGWTSAAPVSFGNDGPLNGPRRWSRLAIATLIVAIAGIPLFGLVTGLIAIVLGCIALAGHSRKWKGAGLAVAGILLGVVDVAGWTIGLTFLYNGPVLTISTAEFEPDPVALDKLKPSIARAMKSNVLIQTPGDLAHLRGTGIGSGIIVRIQDKTAWIVTNRHVVDSAFSEDHSTAGEPALPSVRLTVKAYGQPPVSGQLVWMAPGGIDCALVTIPVTSDEIMAAIWDAEPDLAVGNSVFAVGNPHGLGWSYTRGDLSQLRLQSKGAREIRIIQTSAAINPGNSGGGLYDDQGHLLGINTWTKDKRFAEGLSFSLSFHSLLPLFPAGFHLPASQLEDEDP